MKKVEAIIRPSQLDAVQAQLIEIGISGMIVTPATGFGQEIGFKKNYRGHDFEVKGQDKIKLEVVVPNDLLDIVLDAIMLHARTGAIGDGKIIVLPVEKIFRIRTGETNDEGI